MTVRELQARMDSAELSEWLAYDNIEPLPDGYWAAALIASTTLRAFTGKESKLEDFLPRKVPDKRGALARGRELLARVRRIVQRKEATKGPG